MWAQPGRWSRCPAPWGGRPSLGTWCRSPNASCQQESVRPENRIFLFGGFSPWCSGMVSLRKSGTGVKHHRSTGLGTGAPWCHGASQLPGEPSAPAQVSRQPSGWSVAHLFRMDGGCCPVRAELAGHQGAVSHQGFGTAAPLPFPAAFPHGHLSRMSLFLAWRPGPPRCIAEAVQPRTAHTRPVHPVRFAESPGSPGVCKGWRWGRFLGRNQGQAERGTPGPPWPVGRWRSSLRRLLSWARQAVTGTNTHHVNLWQFSVPSGRGLCHPLSILSPAASPGSHFWECSRRTYVKREGCWGSPEGGGHAWGGPSAW